MKEALDARYGERIPRNHKLMAWLPRQAASTITKFHKGDDGKTAYQRMKGKKFNREVTEFGENVWFLKPKCRGKTGMQGRWSEGIWIGIKDESNEAIVANRIGVYKARSIRRKATQAEKWK